MDAWPIEASRARPEQVPGQAALICAILVSRALLYSPVLTSYLVFSVPVTRPATRPIGAIIEIPLPIFEAVDAFSELSTRRSPGAVAQLTGIAWAAASSFFSFTAHPLTSATKPIAQRLAPIFVLIIFSPKRLESHDACSQSRRSTCKNTFAMRLV
jgi:hypothetical protein